MKRIFLLNECFDTDSSAIGGKGAWLARLLANNIRLPKTLCISTAAYSAFINSQGLSEKIALELNRKEFKDMRWEEIWDASLRIRNLFLKTPLPNDLYDELSSCIEKEFGSMPTAVRSSAPEEDHQNSSFAGLHDSFLNIQGTDTIIHNVKKVWSSLWSDRALLYRQELALSVKGSQMAVVIQKLVKGDVSGIFFTQDPVKTDCMTIEAVYGLNQGLVDGDIEPDRWHLDSSTQEILDHTPPQERPRQVIVIRDKLEFAPVPKTLKNVPPLNSQKIKQLCKEIIPLHSLCNGPLDIEWTLVADTLFILQARPVTALKDGVNKDERSWYLSLHRSLENLKKLRNTIEKEMLPEMAAEAKQDSTTDLSLLSDVELALEIRRRQDRSSYWTERYWHDCIPFAHGIRLFGEVYNDLMVPGDPHEFVILLRGEKMLGIQRNKLIADLANMIRKAPELLGGLDNLNINASDQALFKTAFDTLLEEYGSFFTAVAANDKEKRTLAAKVILEYSKLRPSEMNEQRNNISDIQTKFIKKCSQATSPLDGHELLDLARASYRIRDDDNIYLGRIEELATQAVAEGKCRLASSNKLFHSRHTPEDIAKILEGNSETSEKCIVQDKNADSLSPPMFKARQLLGQPASQGVARGIARVIKNRREISDFKVGEILVVESIDPTMTFFAPLAAGIVEQRGGMLIHGAIIAREYGIPCITGIPQATQYIASGDTIIVDGYLGIVTVDKATLDHNKT